MTKDQREIRRKKRILEYAEQIGNINKACRYFGVARSSFYEWRDRYRELGDVEAFDTVLAELKTERLALVWRLARETRFPGFSPSDLRQAAERGVSGLSESLVERPRSLAARFARSSGTIASGSSRRPAAATG